MDDGRARVLAERQHALDGRLGIAQELQGHVFVVLRGILVFQNGGHLLVVGAAQHELAVVEGLLGQQREGFLGDLEYLLALELGRTDALFAQQPVLRFVLARLEHGRILEIYFVSHNDNAFDIIIGVVA